MRLMTILEVAKNQDFTLFLEDAFLKKHRGAQFDTPSNSRPPAFLELIDFSKFGSPLVWHLLKIRSFNLMHISKNIIVNSPSLILYLNLYCLFL